MDPSPALVLQVAGLAADARDRLLALLSDFNIVAIHEDDLTEPRMWTAHFADVGVRQRAADTLAAHSEFAAVDTRFTDVEDDDWARRTQADLPAIQVGRVLICPPWDVREPAGPDEVMVLIEPSRGFGLVAICQTDSLREELSIHGIMNHCVDILEFSQTRGSK